MDKIQNIEQNTKINLLNKHLGIYYGTYYTKYTTYCLLITVYVHRNNMVSTEMEFELN